MRKRPLYSQGKCIQDIDTSNYLNKLVKSSFDSKDTDISDVFCDTYRQWILTSKNNTFMGLDQYNNSVFSQGTTESFDKFYIRNRNRRVRVYNGEYSYHKYICDILAIDDAPLHYNDCVIVSIPFADSGIEYRYHELMHACTKQNIPVLVDCCWFGLCGSMTFDLSYPCIQDVVFSLSKTFPVNRLRIGIRFSKDYEDGLSVYKRDSYLNFFSQSIGLGLINRFSADYMFNKYREKQLSLCKNLQVTPSPVVNLAIGTDEKWNYLNRGGPHNRLCLSDQLVVED